VEGKAKIKYNMNLVYVARFRNVLVSCKHTEEGNEWRGRRRDRRQIGERRERDTERDRQKERERVRERERERERENN
jgi:hypothetical protein